MTKPQDWENIKNNRALRTRLYAELINGEIDKRVQHREPTDEEAWENLELETSPAYQEYMQHMGREARARLLGPAAIEQAARAGDEAKLEAYVRDSYLRPYVIKHIKDRYKRRPVGRPVGRSRRGQRSYDPLEIELFRDLRDMIDEVAAIRKALNITPQRAALTDRKIALDRLLPLLEITDERREELHSEFLDDFDTYISNHGRSF